KVFSGEITPANYNKAWWDLRLKYQGVGPVTARGEDFFDPGAKYHVPANVPYTRYFLADILQFQFHRELSKIAGCKTLSTAVRSMTARMPACGSTRCCPWACPIPGRMRSKP